VQLADFRGRHVVLEWVNPGCPYVRKHYSNANMQGTQRRRDRARRGLAGDQFDRERQRRLPEPRRRLARWMQDQQATATHTLMDEDGTVGKAYGARTTPHMYIVNAQGVLVYAGGIDSIPSSRVDDIPKATPYIRQGLGEIKAGKPLSVSTSQAYGCSVKYKS
jgi:hypothetical protein